MPSEQDVLQHVVDIRLTGHPLANEPAQTAQEFVVGSFRGGCRGHVQRGHTEKTTLGPQGRRRCVGGVRNVPNKGSFGGFCIQSVSAAHVCGCIQEVPNKGSFGGFCIQSMSAAHVCGCIQEVPNKGSFGGFCTNDDTCASAAHRRSCIQQVPNKGSFGGFCIHKSTKNIQKAPNEISFGTFRTNGSQSCVLRAFASSSAQTARPPRHGAPMTESCCTPKNHCCTPKHIAAPQADPTCCKEGCCAPACCDTADCCQDSSESCCGPNTNSCC